MKTEQANNHHRLAWFVACVVVLGWGINFVLAKHALNQFSVGAFNFIRFGGMVALGWAVIALTGGLTPVAGEDRRRLLLVATRTSVTLGWGDLVSLVVAALYATYLLLNRQLVDRYAPFTLTTYAASLAAIPILLLTAPSLPQQDWAAITPGGWLAMAWVITGPVFVAWSLWNWVLRHLSPIQLAPLLFSVPVTSGLAAWAFLDEQIAVGQVVGTAAVVIGLVLNQRSSSQPPAGPAEVSPKRASL